MHAKVTHHVGLNFPSDERRILRFSVDLKKLLTSVKIEPTAVNLTPMPLDSVEEVRLLSGWEVNS